MWAGIWVLEGRVVWVANAGKGSGLDRTTDVAWDRGAESQGVDVVRVHDVLLGLVVRVLVVLEFVRLWLVAWRWRASLAIDPLTAVASESSAESHLAWRLLDGRLGKVNSIVLLSSLILIACR